MTTIRFSPRILLVLATTCTVLLTPAGTARAHQLLVLKGAGEIDAGTADPTRLVHALLQHSGDELRVTVRPTSGATQAVLYVPDHEPERSFHAGQWPTMTVMRRPATGTIGATRSPGSEVVVDEATGIAYREVVRIPIDTLPRGGQATVIVRRGSEPARVALRVGPPTTFTTDDANSIPRIVQDAMTWADTPPPGTRAAKDKAHQDERSRQRFALVGGAIAVIALCTCAWWLVRGLRTARRRGIERHDQP